MAVVKIALIINEKKGIYNMGIDLFGAGEHSFGWDAWRSLLNVASEFGWEPEGTSAPFYHGTQTSFYNEDAEEAIKWDCRRRSSSGFIKVSDSDARAMSSALFRAADVIMTGKTVKEEQAKALAEALLTDILVLADLGRRNGFRIRFNITGGN
jgi:hypothetical protein